MKRELLEYKKKMIYTALASTCAFSILACSHQEDVDDDYYKYAYVYERSDDGFHINPIKVGYVKKEDLYKAVKEKELNNKKINVDDLDNDIIIERNVDGMPITYIYDIDDKDKEHPIVIYHNDNNNSIEYDYKTLKKIR